jgi:glyoxylase-like metal-dependent hydrolase (beta-lactamase superfamily II)
VTAAPAVIDLRLGGVPRTIAAYLLGGDEPALVDCGPTTCVPALEAGLAELGLGLGDLRHLVLTHIHLDHAGAAGVLVRRNPALRVHVGAVGAPHLADPSRLERSARRLYGAEFDMLWGELAPVPEENIRLAGEHVLELEAFPTPGHASHHVTYLSKEGACYVGDAVGVRISPAPHLLPAAPPPDIDLQTWAETLSEIERRQATAFHLAHFGIFEDVDEHLERMRERLALWAERVRGGMAMASFVALADEELEGDVDPETALSYRTAAPVDSSYLGLERYWQKQAEIVRER